MVITVDKIKRLMLCFETSRGICGWRLFKFRIGPDELLLSVTRSWAIHLTPSDVSNSACCVVLSCVVCRWWTVPGMRRWRSTHLPVCQLEHTGQRRRTHTHTHTHSHFFCPSVCEYIYFMNNNMNKPICALQNNNVVIINHHSPPRVQTFFFFFLQLNVWAREAEKLVCRTDAFQDEPGLNLRNLTHCYHSTTSWLISIWKYGNVKWKMWRGVWPYFEAKQHI